MSERAKGKKELWGRLLRLLVSAGLLALLFSSISMRQLLQVVEGTSILTLALFPLLFFASVLFSSLKWKILLDQLDVKESLWQLFLIYTVSYFWGSFLPTTIGGDGYRFLRMRALHPGKDKEIFSAIVLDRAYGFGTLIALHILAALYFFEILSGTPLLLWIEAFIVLGLAIAGVLWMLRAPILRLRWDRYNWIEKLLEKVGKILALMENQSLWTAGASIFISAVFVWVGVWAWKVCYSSVGGQVNSLFLLYASSLSNIIGMLPISVNGLGLVELVQNLTVRTQNVSGEIIIAAALTARVLGILMAAIGGLVYLLQPAAKVTTAQ